MIAEYIQQHPNNGKVIVYTEAYLQMRLTLMQQIATIENAIQGTLLSNDVDIKQRLLPSLKRQLKGLQNQFEKKWSRVNVESCAHFILDGERELITEPLLCCRYYDGKAIAEDENALYAEYEMFWTEWRQPNSDSYSYMADIIVEYLYYGLMWFADHDKAPLSLKALLFNRYCHWNYGGVDGFKNWYNNTYRRLK